MRSCSKEYMNYIYFIEVTTRTENLCYTKNNTSIICLNKPLNVVQTVLVSNVETNNLWWTTMACRLTQITTPQSSLPPLLPTTPTCPPKSFISSWRRKTSLFQARGILSCDASPTTTAQPQKTRQTQHPRLQVLTSPNSPQNLFAHWRPTSHRCFVMSCHARM